MNLSSAQLNTISRIYDTLLDPSKWVDILDDLAVQMACVGCNIFVADHTQHELTVAHISRNLIPLFQYYIENEYDEVERPVLSEMNKIITRQGLIPIKKVYEKFNKLNNT